MGEGCWCRGLEALYQDFVRDEGVCTCGKARAKRRAGFGDTDPGLVERAVRNARIDGLPRWVAVKRIFAVGSTSAHALCRRFGLDPDEECP